MSKIDDCIKKTDENDILKKNEPKILDRKSEDIPNREKKVEDNVPKDDKNKKNNITDTKNNGEKKITLEEIKNQCPSSFLEKFELLQLVKSGSAGCMVKGQLNTKNNNINRLIGFKFLIDPKRESRKTKNDHNKHLEISMLNLLKNPHFPEILGYYKIGEDSCIAMEYVKYGDLENFKKNILKRCSLSETFVLFIAGGIIDALEYLHYRQKIIHMDIKQQNILIDDFLVVKLTDFSVSLKYKTSKDYINLPMVGTCYYMSPEVLDRKRINVKNACKIDIYSLGVLLYLLAYCDYPYKLNSVDSKNYSQIKANILNNELEFPKETGHSQLFEDFLKKCLNKDITERYNLCQLKNHPWYKGYQIILNEKEKVYNAGKFVIDLMVDNILSFNKYLEKFKYQKEP
jgi:serine/threonine protein kinase